MEFGVIPNSWVLLILAGIVGFYLIFIRETRASKMLGKIPGPPRLPIFGNALDLNVSNTDIMSLLKDWKDRYGKRYVYFIGMCNPQVVITDARDAEEENIICPTLDAMIKLKHENENMHEDLFTGMRFGAMYSQFSGGIFCAKLMHHYYAVICNASLVEKVLSSQTHINKSVDYTFLHKWLGTGLLTSSSEKWKSRRKMLTPTFHFRILDDFLDVFNEQSKTLVHILQKEFGDGKVFNVFPYVTRCALDIISETAMGRKLNAQKNVDADYVKAVYRISELVQIRQMRPWFHPDFIWYNLSSHGREETKCLSILHGFTEKVIKEKKLELKELHEREKREENPDGEMYTGKKRLAFLDLLLEGQAAHKLSDTDIREETDTFMFEGHDTTASNANWTIFLLGSYPQYQAKVHEELDSIFGDDRERNVTAQDLTQMKYLECCIKEALRLYPSVPFLGRAIETDLKLDENVILPGGTTAFIMPFQLHRDPEWFPQPEVFLPDRFFADATNKRHPFAYVPFSAGPRNCIGQKFAMMEEKVLVSCFLRNFKVEAVDRREDLTLLAELILRPANGLNIRIFPR